MTDYAPLTIPEIELVLARVQVGTQVLACVPTNGITNKKMRDAQHDQDLAATVLDWHQRGVRDDLRTAAMLKHSHGGHPIHTCAFDNGYCQLLYTPDETVCEEHIDLARDILASSQRLHRDKAESILATASTPTRRHPMPDSDEPRVGGAS